MVLLVTHPDYMQNQERRQVYQRFLESMCLWDDAWHALPMDIATWWKSRLASRVLVNAEGKLEVNGPDSRVELRLVSQVPDPYTRIAAARGSDDVVSVSSP